MQSKMVTLYSTIYESIKYFPHMVGVLLRRVENTTQLVTHNHHKSRQSCNPSRDPGEVTERERLTKPSRKEPATWRRRDPPRAEATPRGPRWPRRCVARSWCGPPRASPGSVSPQLRALSLYPCLASLTCPGAEWRVVRAHVRLDGHAGGSPPL